VTTTVTLSATEVIGHIAAPLTGLPACIAGSTVAAEVYDLPLSENSDVDVFCYSEQALIAAVQRLLSAGFPLNPRHERVWERWLQYGLRSWHTNSIKLVDEFSGTEINLVHKLMGGHPTSSLPQVLESFDFGLLAVGYDLRESHRQDLRSFLFPKHPLDGPLPLMPNKRTAWRSGFISQYNGLREVGRYAKYVTYGHDLSLVKDDLIEGYMSAALYMSQRDDPLKIQLGLIYDTIARKIEMDDIPDLMEAGEQILTLDSLDLIMEALE